MKIKHLLTEEKNDLFETIIASQYFKDNILPYIENRRMPPELVHGGYKIESRKIIQIKERSEPTDSTKVVHNLVNELSQEKFGVNVRNLFFATQSPEKSENYGKTITVVPLDADYKLYYNDVVEDMYSESGGLFSFINYTKKRGKVILDTMKTKEARQLESKIYRILKGTDNDSLSKSITYYLYDIVYSARFYNGFLDDNIEHFDSISELKDVTGWHDLHKSFKNGIVEVYKRLFESENDVDIDQVNFRSSWNEIGELAELFIENLIPVDISTLYERAEQYVSFLRKVTNLEKIPESYEIMCSPGRYATLDTFKQDMHSLVMYYRKRYE